MSHYGSFSDDFCIDSYLNTELPLPNHRDTISHFFQQLQKKIPTMRQFYNRTPTEFLLSEEKDDSEEAAYHWAMIQQRRVSSGIENPDSVTDALEQHRYVLELSEHLLSVNPIDCDCLTLLFSFDFNYQGNHNALISETLGMSPILEKFHQIQSGALLNLEPSLVLTLSEDHRTQCRFSIETRTTEEHLRAQEFPEEELTVYLSMKRYGSLDEGESLQSRFDELVQQGMHTLDNFLIPQVVLPLKENIAIR